MNVFSPSSTAAKPHGPCPARLGSPSASCRVDLVVIGARGQVGTALRAQIDRQASVLRRSAGIDLRLVAAYDRRGFAFDLHGLDTSNLEISLQPRRPGDSERLNAHLVRTGAERTLVVDCTASDDISDQYLGWLASGVGVVGANKRANSRSQAVYRQLQEAAQRSGAPYRYETTVGAAIPLLGPVRDLRLRGESVRSIRGVLSGSLSYILHRMHEGIEFSAAVAEAQSLGYTEPDPMEDLRAHDLGRKLLVLAREAGFDLEPSDVQVDALVGEENDGADFLHACRRDDPAWKARIAAAEAAGERWVVLAEADASGGRIALQRVPDDSAFGRLLPGENLVELRTSLQHRTPLVLSGQGAGAELTAAGVLSDIISAASQFAAERRR